ncbi:MAG: HK97-gp10 family putative phage morphogenesis protein [bacterium]
MLNIEMRGWREIQASFAQLGKAGRLKNVHRKALYAGGVVIRARARELCPVKTGRLRKAIQVKRHRGTPETTHVSVGIDYRKVRYGHLVEFGSPGRETKSGKSTGPMPAQPFMRPAFEATKEEVTNAIQNKTIEAVYEEVRRLRKRVA